MPDDDPLAPAQTSRVGRTKDRRGTEKGGSLAFELPELQPSTQRRLCQPLSPICDCKHRDTLLSTQVDLEGDLARPRRRYSDLNRFRDELLRVRSAVQEVPKVSGTLFPR
jgi:hypothetical protein